MASATFLATFEKELAAAVESGKADLLRFQNHFYGCVAILEMLAEKELADTSGIEFKTVGVDFGFYENPALAFGEGVSLDVYRHAWEWAWKHLSGSMKDVDEIEELLLAKMKAADGLGFFTAALATGELDAGMEAAVDALLLAAGSEQPAAMVTESPKASQPRRRRTTRHHAITPIQRKRMTAHTRRKRPSIPASKD
ncbi:hypothetical protein [Roseateles sp.]|jgi:hypothetical protein|uniref:hypothetical protein n=1 Tax=Roseateles sp. TaxID=1971397 RepID=UPI0037CAAB3C